MKKPKVIWRKVYLLRMEGVEVKRMSSIHPMRLHGCPWMRLALWPRRLWRLFLGKLLDVVKEFFILLSKPHYFLAKLSSFEAHPQ